MAQLESLHLVSAKPGEPVVQVLSGESASGDAPGSSGQEPMSPFVQDVVAGLMQRRMDRERLGIQNGVQSVLQTHEQPTNS